MGRGLAIDDAVSARELRWLAFRARSVRKAKRMLAVANALDGMSRADAAASAGRASGAARRRDPVQCRRSGGPRRPSGTRTAPALTEGELALLAERMFKGPDPEVDGLSRWTLPDLAAFIEERFGKLVTPQSLSRILRREGFSHQKVRPAHPKQRAEGAAATHPDKRFVLYFQDEMRVGQKGRLCHRWWLKRERAPGRQDRRFSFTYLFGAARADGESAFALVLPEVGKRAMGLFLDSFAETLDPKEHAVMVLDGAGWNDARALVIPPNVTLAPLPPYSPQLNPMERVWLFPRERYLSLRLLPDEETILDACCTAWNALIGEADRLQSLCFQPWIQHVIQYVCWYRNLWCSRPSATTDYGPQALFQL